MTAADGWRFDVLHAHDAAVAASALASSCFQHPQWVLAVAAARSRAHRFVAVRAQRGGLTRAWTFGAVHRRAGLSVFEAMPMGGYGGWVAEQALSLTEEHALNVAWLAQAPWALLALTSRPGRDAALPPCHPVRWAPQGLRQRLGERDFCTHVLALSADPAVQLMRTRARMRSYLRKFDELGFSFERANDAAALARMHHWYVQGSRAWQIPPEALLPEGFFTAMAGWGHADVWTVRFDGQVVGAALFLLGRSEVQYQASGSERIAGALSATDAVVWAAMRHYGQCGMATINFGASESLDGVARFKQKFGAEPLGYRRSTYLLPRLIGLGDVRQHAGEAL